MISETVTSLELIRFVVACYGIRAAWRGRGTALLARQGIDRDGMPGLHERSIRAQRSERMRLFETIQTGILLVHLLLLVNVLVNFCYASAPIEQPNVMSSNIAQILIPFVLIRVSEMVVVEMRTVASLRAVAGEPPTRSESHPS
jgi:hypothetical protein